MWKNTKNKSFRGRGKKKYYTKAEKASYYAGLRAGKRIASGRRSSGKRRY